MIVCDLNQMTDDFEECDCITIDNSHKIYSNALCIKLKTFKCKV